MKVMQLHWFKTGFIFDEDLIFYFTPRLRHRIMVLGCHQIMAQRSYGPQPV